MKGFFSWFKQKTKMKRWLVLMLIGILLCCYGMATILTSKQMAFGSVAKIIAIFVVGFICVIVSVVSIQRRTLELLVTDTDNRAKEDESKVKSLIYNKKVYHQGPKIVAIGGGAGLNAVLKGVKKYTDNITAIVTVSDYGEAKTDSRKILETLPLNDVKDSLIALAENEEQMDKLLNYNFTNGQLRNLCFGDIYLHAMNRVCGDFTESIKQSDQILNITGKVLPVTLDEIDICAELENGTVIESRDKIPEMVNETTSKINRVFINPSNCRPAPGVLEAIAEADAIIIGPGSLYTNIIPNLLVKGVAKAIKESNAFKIYVSNLMTEPGQTDNFTLSDHIRTIHEHVGKGVIDYCIYDTGEVIPEYIKKYNKEGADLVEQKLNDPKIKKIKFIKKNISTIIDGKVRHDPYMVAESAIKLICNDLKYEDREDDPEYVMLNAKLKSDKRINKIKKMQAKMEKKEQGKQQDKNKKSVRKSKFNSKYSDRIQSIRESDEKFRRNHQK